MTHSAKMMWACAAILALALGLVAASASSAYLLFAIPCMIMMGAMFWMMMRGAGGGRRD